MREICMSGSMSEVWRRSQGRTSEAPPNERGGNRYVRPTATAPHLDSTAATQLGMTDLGAILPARQRGERPVRRSTGLPGNDQDGSTRGFGWAARQPPLGVVSEPVIATSEDCQHRSDALDLLDDQSRSRAMSKLTGQV